MFYTLCVALMLTVGLGACGSLRVTIANESAPPAAPQNPNRMRMFVSSDHGYREAGGSGILQYLNGIWVEGERGPMRIQIISEHPDRSDRFVVKPSAPPTTILVHGREVCVTWFAQLPMFDENTTVVVMTPDSWKDPELDRPFIVLELNHKEYP